MWRRLFGKTRARHAPPARRFRPRVESLEDRCAPALLAGVTHVNVNGQGNQNSMRASAAANGLRVVTWVQVNEPSYQVRARIFNANNVPLTGDIVVANNVAWSSPGIATDRLGNAVIAYARMTTPWNWDVVAQRLSNTGRLLGPPLIVAATPHREHYQSVARAANGSFVVTYLTERSLTKSDVYVRMYTAAGALQRAITVAATPAMECAPVIAGTQGADGRFNVAFTSPSGLRLHRYNGRGALLGATTLAPASAGYPQLAVDDFGRSVVVWTQGSNVLARKVSAAGVAGPVIGIATGARPDFVLSPVVAVDRRDGDFVVAFTTELGRDRYRCFVSEYSATGVRRARLAIGDAVGQGIATMTAVAVDAAGRYFVAWEAYNIAGDPGYGIFARRGVLS